MAKIAPPTAERQQEMRVRSLARIDDPDPRVRRRACRTLDDLPLTDDVIAALSAALRDPDPGVRQAALHSLACEACKPDGCSVDVRPLAEPLLGDPSAVVRKAAVGVVYGSQDPDTRPELERMAREDPSRRVREGAQDILDDWVRKDAANATRLALSPEIRARVDRHAGKWVAVVGGSIIAADRFLGQIRRDVRGVGSTDARICWVPEDLARAAL